MTVYIVLWLASSCPGGVFKGLVPKSLRPLVCEQVPASALYSSLPDAVKRVQEIGPAARVEMCHEDAVEFSCKPLSIRWEPFILGR